MPSIIQPGPSGGIHGRSVSPRCGQGGQGGGIWKIGCNQGGMGRKPIILTLMPRTRFGVSGITKDSTGAVLPSCRVDCFSESKAWLGQVVSDGAGAFAFTGIGVGSVFLVAYLEGSPEVAGTTIHNVAPTTIR